MGIELSVESFHSARLLFYGKHISVKMSGAAAYETTIEIERKFTQIRWIVFGERVQNTFLYTPDWNIPFVHNPPPIIFNKAYRIRCKYCSGFIRIIIPAWIRIMSNRRFHW